MNMPAGTTARVLTVEDDPIVRADLRLILEDHGFEVCADARDGVEAVELAREHPPRPMPVDLEPPGLDRVEANRRLPEGRQAAILPPARHLPGDSSAPAV